MPKGTCPAEAMLNSENVKPVALAVIKLRLSEGISQLLSQSVENIFHSNLLKAFPVDLKACCYLTNTASLSSGKSA